MKNMIIEYWPISNLIPYVKNPVKNDFAIGDMAALLREFGFKIPMLVKQNCEVIDGHLRLKAARQLGLNEIPVIVVDDWTDSQIRAFRIASRNSAKWAIWDTDLLKLELENLELDFDFNLLGFKELELDNLFTDNSVANDNAQSVNLIPREVLVKKGDLFQIGKHHRVMCGDSTNEQDVKLLMNKEKATMIFEDPPYNLSSKHLGCEGGAKNGYKKSQIKEHGDFCMASGELNSEEFTKFLSDIFELNIKYSVDGSIHYICMDWRHIYEIYMAGKLYTEFKQLCVWNKDNAGMGAFYRSKHELIFVFKNGKNKHINNFSLGETGRYRTNVWDYPTSTSFSVQRRVKTDKGEVCLGAEDLERHPTPKPLQLVADAILDCSTCHGVILDLFLGGGTTLIACEQTGRICYGMEIEGKYVQASIGRYYQFCVEADIGIDFKHLNGDLKLGEIVNGSTKKNI